MLCHRAPSRRQSPRSLRPDRQGCRHEVRSKLRNPPNPVQSSLSRLCARMSSSEERRRTEPLRRLRARLRPTPVAMVPRIALARPSRTPLAPRLRPTRPGSTAPPHYGEPPAAKAAPVTQAPPESRSHLILSQRLRSTADRVSAASSPASAPRQCHVSEDG